MNQKKRDHFYKYFNFEGIYKTLCANSIRLTAPSLFNDPFDINFSLNPPLSVEEVTSYVVSSIATAISEGHHPKLARQVLEKDKEDIIQKFQGYKKEEIEKILLDKIGDLSQQQEQTIAKINKEMRVFFNDLFVYCVSEEHTNILMWSHYADKHRGAVIKFKCINEIDNIFLAANRVKYCEQFPTFGNREEWISYIEGGSGISAPHFYNEVLHSKSRHWEYELEWRIVVPMKEKAGEDYAYSKFYPEEIPEIYIGCEMSPENKNNLITLIRTKFPNTKIFEGIKSKKNFKIDFVELELI